MVKLIKKRTLLLLGTISLLILSNFASLPFKFSRISFLGENFSEKDDYDPNTSLNLEWNKTEIKNGEGVGNDIVLDGQGNAYIAGKEYSSSKGAYEIVIAKYNNTGDLKWKVNWGNESDNIGYGLVLDNSQNNIFVVGSTKNTTADLDLLLVKFDVNGNYLWNRTWGGNQEDIGYAVIVDDSNNIFIAGSTESFGTPGFVVCDVVLIKYDSEGNFDWYKTWGGTDTEYAYDLAMDSNSNIFLTGYTSSFGAEISDLFLLKFNITEEFEWFKQWGGEEFNEGRGIVIDLDNNIYIGGNTENSGQFDLAFLTYNSSGDLKTEEIWGAGEDDKCYDIAVDSDNNRYLVGFINSSGTINGDICIVKFNSSSKFQWYKASGDNLNDVAYGIAIDSSDNLFVTGKIESSETNYDLFLQKYSQNPDNFVLMSDKANPIPDGNFTLSWSKSLDAKNYTLYRSDNPIVKIDLNVIKVVEGNTNRTYSLKNFEEGIYYFLVIAFNSYGNGSSNCLKIVVQFPPNDFTLFENPENPDKDGQILLSWEESIGADNYSVYSHNSYILEIDNNGTLEMENITELSYLVEGLTNQEIYYVVMAKNEAGTKISNCIQVIVRRKPDSLVIYADENPDDDGNFDVIWSSSEFADNYSLYYSTSYITKIDGCEILLDGYIPDFSSPTYKYPIKNKGDGSYYFRIAAFNEYGNFTSLCLEVVVKMEESGGDDDDDEDDGGGERKQSNISPYLVSGLLGVSFCASLVVLIYLKYFKSRAQKIKIKR
ncbi:MAG: hypothetical protein ACFFAN_12485 [Promethearchaeota archaeon]